MNILIVSLTISNPDAFLRLRRDCNTRVLQPP
jgi:hypothetical protein